MKSSEPSITSTDELSTTSPRQVLSSKQNTVKHGLVELFDVSSSLGGLWSVEVEYK